MDTKTAVIGGVVILGVAGGIYLLTRKPSAGAATTSPGAITGITVTPTATGATVNWTAPTGTATTELLVTDSAGNPSSTPVVIGGQSGTDFQIAGTQADITAPQTGQPVYFTLRAC